MAYQKKYPEEFYQNGNIYKYTDKNDKLVYRVKPWHKKIEFLTDEDYETFDKRLSEMVDNVVELAVIKFLTKTFPKYFN